MQEENLKSLNPQQRRAVTWPKSSALVLAGAGTGKTRVLVSRINYLLTEGICLPREILTITFTNRAAKEIYKRLGDISSINPGDLWIGTFHAICNRILRAHHTLAQLPQNFRILDQDDQLTMIRRVIRVKKLGIGDNPEWYDKEAKFIQRDINQFKDRGIRSHQEENLRLFFSQLSKNRKVEAGYFERLVNVYKHYEETIKEEGACDFSELILRCYELLKDNLAIREQYQKQFSFILIDEFQDINNLQYKLIKQLADREDNHAAAVFAVGDDDQSIYSFRDTNPLIMRQYSEDFKITEPISLEQNYRNVRHILETANGLIKRNKRRLSKNVWTNIDDGKNIHVYETGSAAEEASFVVNKIKEYRDKGVEYKDIAILYRVNGKSQEFEKQLRLNNIPCCISGGLRYFDLPEIKNTIAFLRMAENPTDNVAFLRIATFTQCGLSLSDVQNVLDASEAERISCFEATVKLSNATGRFRSFISLINDISAQKKQMCLKEFINYVVGRSNLINAYDGRYDEEEKLENLMHLDKVAVSALKESILSGKEYESLSPLEKFLTYVSLTAGEKNTKENENAVQLMTVHSSKGLEFDYVFISVSGMPHFLGDPEEERRLMYVAMTRAKKELHITSEVDHLYKTRSAFLDELKTGDVIWLTPKRFFIDPLFW